MKKIKVKFYENLKAKPMVIKGKDQKEISELLELLMN